MDTQTANPRGYDQKHDPNIVRHQHEEEDEHPHEKISVLNMVKAKARKIKDTIKKHGHGHNDDHSHDHEGHVPDDHDLDEEDEDEKKIDEDPEVHGAPKYESAAVKKVVSGQPEELSHLRPDPLAPRESAETFYSGNDKTKDNDPANNLVPGHEALVTEQPRVNLGKTAVIVKEPQAPQNTPVPSSQQSKDANPTKTFVHAQEEYHPGQPKVNPQRPKGLEEHPAVPKDTPDAYNTTNYQTKVTDPTGKGEATGITPIIHSLDKMNIHDEQDTGTEQNLPPGTHHRASELSFPTGSHDQFCPEPTRPLPTETTENPPLVSGTADTTKPQEQSHNIASDKPSNQSSYTEKMSSATSAIADRAVSAKNIVASTLGYGEKDQTPVNESHEGRDATKQASAENLTPEDKKVAGAGSTVMSKLHGPGTGTASEVGTEVPEQDKGVSNQSSYTEKMSSAPSVIADKAVSAKNIVASKLGYGEKDQTPVNESHEGRDATKQASAENLTVYEKVAGAGSTVMSKLHVPGTGTASKAGTEVPEQSEVNSDVLRKRKEDPEKETRGKVTESEEVASVLSAGDERDKRAGSGSVNSPTKGVVGTLKGAIGSWFGKGEESQGVQQAHDSSYGNEGFSSSAGETKLKE